MSLIYCRKADSKIGIIILKLALRFYIIVRSSSKVKDLHDAILTRAKAMEEPRVSKARLANFMNAKQRLDELANGRTVLAPQAAELAKLWWAA